MEAGYSVEDHLEAPEPDVLLVLLLLIRYGQHKSNCNGKSSIEYNKLTQSGQIPMPSAMYTVATHLRLSSSGQSVQRYRDHDFAARDIHRAR